MADLATDLAVDYGLVEAATNRIMEVNGLILLQNQLISPDYVNQLGTMINAQLGVRLTKRPYPTSRPKIALLVQ